MPEFIDPVFTKTSPKRSFSLNRKRAFWLVFAKTGSIISGTVLGKNCFREGCGIADPDPHAFAFSHAFSLVSEYRSPQYR